MEIKNGELMQLLNGLSYVRSKISPKVNYNVGRNKKLLIEEVKAYNEEITKLQKEHCKLDDKGELLIHEENKVAFLDKDHENLLNVAVKEINDATCDLPIRMVKFEDIPEAVEQAEMDGLLFMIEDEENITSK